MQVRRTKLLGRAIFIAAASINSISGTRILTKRKRVCGRLHARSWTKGKVTRLLGVLGTFPLWEGQGACSATRNLQTYFFRNSAQLFTPPLTPLRLGGAKLRLDEEGDSSGERGEIKLSRYCPRRPDGFADLVARLATGNLQIIHLTRLSQTKFL